MKLKMAIRARCQTPAPEKQSSRGVGTPAACNRIDYGPAAAGRAIYLFPLTRPGATLPGACVLRSLSMKMKLSGGAAQINWVL